MHSLSERIAQRLPLIQEVRQLLTPAADLSAAKHVQLLRMTHARLHFSFTLLPFVSAFAVFFYGRNREAWALAAWALGYCLAYWFSRARVNQFEADAKRLPDEQFFAIWFPKLKRVAAWHGLALCAPFVLTLHDNSFEFMTLWYLALAAIVAGNATHQTPVLAVFASFFNCSWNVATALAYFAYPDLWYYIMPMIFTYTVGISRHALMAHQFFLQQVRLEESSTQLAEQFKQAKEVAEDALKTKNRFLATASHDLRQPVHAMGMLIEAISHRNQDPGLEAALADLRSSQRAMNLMFNSLLDLSKLESGVMRVERKSVHLQPLMQEILTLFASEAQSRHLQLRLRLPKQAAYALADPSLLRQVLLNLTQNALRYTPSGGVLLAARKRGAAWQLEVWDTGIGVAKETQANIYLPYFRQAHAWGIDSEGHGLGLSVVARCALLMKAPIDMQSRLGRGSRFWISVTSLSPDLQDHQGTAEDSAAWTGEQHIMPPINQGRCLVVEDDPQVARAWQALMHTWGIELFIASNSAEALACLRAGFEPQVILCDERLRAGESGFDLLKALLAQLPNAHGAMVSGEFDSPALRQAEDEGYLVFRKPVEIHLIHDVLNRWLTDASSSS